MRQAYDYWQDQPGNCRQTTHRELPTALRRSSAPTRVRIVSTKCSACEGVDYQCSQRRYTDVRWDLAQESRTHRLSRRGSFVYAGFFDCVSSVHQGTLSPSRRNHTKVIAKLPQDQPILKSVNPIANHGPFRMDSCNASFNRAAPDL